MRKNASWMAVALLVVGTSACTRQQNAEVQQETREAGREVAEAGRAVGDAAKEAGRDVKEGFERADDKSKQVAREAGREIKEESREATANVNAARVRFQRDMETRLDKLDRDIDQIQARAKTADDRARAKYNREVAELEDERREARRKYNELKGATDDGWERFKSGMETAANGLERTYNRTLEKMKTNN